MALRKRAQRGDSRKRIINPIAIVFWGCLVFWALIAWLFWPRPAKSADLEYTISQPDPGGLVLVYRDHYSWLLEHGYSVRIDARCDSSCTQVFILPADRICATRRASFGFHAGSSSFGAALLWASYPVALRSRLGKLTPALVTLRWPETAQFIRACP